MNIDTGLILPEEIIRQRYKSTHETSRWVPMVIPPSQKQLMRKRVARNDPCPCGSGKKFKKCCAARR